MARGANNIPFRIPNGGSISGGVSSSGGGGGGNISSALEAPLYITLDEKFEDGGTVDSIYSVIVISQEFQGTDIYLSSFSKYGSIYITIINTNDTQKNIRIKEDSTDAFNLNENSDKILEMPAGQTNNLIILFNKETKRYLSYQIFVT